MLTNTAYRLKTQKKLNVGYFGGSITEANGWRVKTTAWLRSAYPDADITEIQAAIGGTGSSTGVYRCDFDLLSKKPNLVFLEYAVNDGVYCDYKTVSTDFESIIRKIYTFDPTAEIVIVYTATKYVWDEWAKGNGSTARQAHDDLGLHYGIPRLDMGLALIYEVNKAGGDWTVYAPDTVHPNDAGHDIYTAFLTPYLHGALDCEPNALAEKVMPTPLNPPDSLKPGAALLDAAECSNESWTLVEKSLCGRYPRYIESDKPGAELSFAFKGNEIGLYWMLAGDGGDIVYSIDGGEEKHLRAWDGYCLSFNRLACPIIAAKLGDGGHILRLRIAETKDERSNGHAIRIGAFAINPR